MSISRLIQRHPDLDAALKRLAGALDLLEAAVVRHDRAEGERRDLGDVLAAMEEDRGRLAEELDAARKARATLAEAAEEVAGRLRSTGTVLRGLIGQQEMRDARDEAHEVREEPQDEAPADEAPPGTAGETMGGGSNP